jgi:hypothetical protein
MAGWFRGGGGTFMGATGGGFLPAASLGRQAQEAIWPFAVLESTQSGEYKRTVVVCQGDYPPT